VKTATNFLRRLVRQSDHGDTVLRAGSLSIEELEPRLLLSAVLPADPGNLDHDGAIYDTLEPLAPAPAPDARLQSGPPDAGPAAEVTSGPREIVFIDAGVADVPTLLAGMAADTEVIILDGNLDGIEQISEVLARRTGIDAVHILSHGSTGGMQLGGSWLTATNVNLYADEISGWAYALTADADLLLYGCDLAADSDGQALIAALSVFTGADVAASEDPTGAASEGGDWDLEYRAGAIQAATAFSHSAASNWRGLLAAPVAADDSYTVNEDSTLTVNWWNTAWSTRQQVTFTGNTFAGAENLTNYPVLIKLNSGNIDYSKTQNNGADLRFFDADGTPLAYDIDKWDEAGDSYVWVKVPQVNTSGTDTIQMYYGNAAAPAGENQAAVWTGNQYAAVYHLSETSGTTAADASPSGFSGTLTNGVAPYAAGQLGGAQSFDGSNDYINLGTNRNFINGLGQVTLSAWVNPTALVGSSNVFNLSINNGGSPSGSTRAGIFLTNTGQISAVARSPDAQATGRIETTTTTVPTGSWSHVAAVFNYATDTITIYVNGALQASTSSGPALTAPTTDNTNTDSASIGSEDDGSGGFFTGRIDEVRAARTARSAAWIQADYLAMTNAFVTVGGQQLAPATGGVLGNDTDADNDSLTAVLVSGPANGRLTLNPDGTFTYIPDPDFSGADSFTYRANDGTSNSNVATVTLNVTAVNDAPTATDRALIFDGTDLVVIAPQPNLVMSSTLTMEATVQRTGALGGIQIILNKEGEYELGISATGKLQWAFDNVAPDWNWVETSYTLPADTWVHVAVTYNGGVVNTYVNGALVDTYNGSGTIGDEYPLLNDLTIGGRQNTTGQRFVGLIDEVRVWNVARSSAEILAAWNTALAGNETGLVGYWRFSEVSGTTAVDGSPQGYNGVLGNGVPADVPVRTLGYTTAEDTALPVPAAGVLTRATDPDGNPLTAILVSGPTNAASFTLNADGSFSYTPTANFTGTDSFVFVASDGTLSSPPATVYLTITPVNDPPAATNLSAGETYTEDTALNLTDIVVSDVDSATVTVTLTLSNVAAGSLNTGTSGAVTSTFVGGVWTASGAIADVNVLLAGLTFTPALNFNSNFTIATSVSDGVAAPVTGTKAMTGVAVNDPPLATNLSAGETYTEDTALNLIDIVVSDVDSGTVTVTLTLSNVAAGSLNTGTSGAVTSTFVAGVWTASGALADVNVLLAGLTFTPASNFNSNFTIATSVSDGVAAPVTGTKAMTGVAVNDPPVNTLPVSQVTARNAAIVLSATNGNQISIGDVDAGGNTVRVTLTGTSGQVTLASLAGLSFTVGDGTADTTMTFTGTIASINTALNGLSFNPTAGFVGSAALQITTEDLGNTGSGGAQTTVDSLQIEVVVEFRANTTVAGNQTEPSVAMGAYGDYVVVWTSDSGQDGNGRGIFGQRYDRSGNPLGVEFQINTYTADDQNRPAVATDGNGNFVVAWTSKDQDGSGRGIYARRFDSSGTPVGAEFLVNATVAGNQDQAAAAMAANGSFVITWKSDQSGTKNDIYARRYDATGVAQGSEFLVNVNVTNTQDLPAVAMDAAGNFVIAWKTNDSGSGIGKGVIARRFDATGTPLSGEFTVNTTDTGDQDKPALAMAGNGTFVITWVSNNQDGSGRGVYAQRYASSGAALGSEFRVNTTTSNDQDWPSVGMDATGAFTIAWASSNQDGSGKGIFAQRYDSSGTAVGGEFRANGTTDNDQKLPAVAMSAVGDLVVVWQGKGIGDNSGAFGQLYQSANDPPVNTIPAAQVTAEDTALVFSAGNGNQIQVGDVDALAMPVQVTLTAANGTLTLSTTAGLTFSSGGNGTAAMQFTGTLASVNAALNGMAFAPTANYNGAASVSITTSDQGNTGSGGALSDADVINITVTSVNDAPSGANGTVTTPEDTAYTFAAGDFGFSDPDDSPANTLAGVKITTLPGAGTLTNNGIVVTLGQTISLADISLNRLVFTPAANANGAGYASFTFQVQDSGGGSDLDPTPNTMTIDVTAVNDAPVLSGSNNLASINQDPVSNPGTLVSALISGQVTDVDAGAFTGIAVTAVDNSNGTWEYSTDGGGSWLAFGTPSDAVSRLLAADLLTRVRFVPNAGWSGTVSNGITFRAWDQATGIAGDTASTLVNGTTTAYSAATAAASIAVNPTGSILGTIWEDVNGDGGLADAVAAGNVFVRLYRDDGDGTPDADDNLVGTTLTAGGVYSFSGLSNDTYWVVVDSKTITPGAGLKGGFGTGDIWAEQTYGSAGSVGFNGGYTFSGVAGTFYGGMRGNVSDDAAALAIAEHVTRVVTTGSAVAGVDSAFSFNVVTTIRGGDTADDDGAANRSIQGSLRQFIQNANAIVGANAMRFVPADAPNVSAGASAWWRVTVSSALPVITDAGTTIDGTAYEAADGVTVRNTNAGQLGAGGTVGTGGFVLGQVERPELEIQGDRTVPAGSVVAAGLDINANDATVRNVSIYGFGRGLFNNNFANIVVRSGVSGTLIESNIIGSGAASFSDPGAASRTSGANILLDNSGSATIRDNLIGFASGQGIWGYNTATALTITRNEIRGNVLGGANFIAGIDIDAGASHTISQNRITGQSGPGINLNGTAASDVIRDNTIDGNGIGVPANYTAGIRLGGGSGGLIEKNVITANVGAGVLVTSSVTGVTISQNSIYGNGPVTGQIGIDLLTPADAQSRGTAPFVTLNAPGARTGGNNLLNFPVLESARVVGGNLIVTGWSKPGTTIEFFIADGGSGFGEGQTYVATLVEGSGTDADAGVSSYGPGAINGVVQGSDTTSRFSFTIAAPAGVSFGTYLTATATDAAGNTSEFSANLMVNSAPLLAGANNLASITEDPASNPGTLVAALIAGQVTDDDPAAQSGIAVTGIDNSNGTWEYSLNGGGSWLAFGAPTDGTARLLAAAPGVYVRFVPNADWNGTVGGGLTFRAWDQTSGLSGDTADTTENGGSTSFSAASASSSITVNPVNDAPVTTPVTLTAIAEDSGPRLITQAELLANASDVDGPSLAATGLAISAGSGSLVDNGDGTWTYTPALDDDTSVTFSYTITDGIDPIAATASLDITPVNDPPVTSPVTLAAIGEDSGPRLITQAELLASASDVDGPPLAATGLAISAGSGSLVDNGDGTWTYTPALDDDTSVTFSYTITDGIDPVAATASLDITPVNDEQVLSTNTGTTVLEGSLGNVITAAMLATTDPDHTPAQLVYTLTSVPVNGVLRLGVTNLVVGSTFTQADIDSGLISYLHDGTETTSDSFAFSVDDGVGSVSTDTFSINVTSVNDPPVVTAASLTLNEGQTVTLSPADFAITDPDDAGFTYTVSGVSGGYFQLSSAAGVPITTFTSADLASSLVQFVDDDNELAPAFSVTVNDGDVDSNTLAATIIYTPVNDPPVTTPVTLTAIGEDSGPRLITQAELLANASDVDGPSLAATGLAISAGSGSLVDNGDGTWTYTPALDDDTSVSFSYTITDGIDPIAATASLDITPVNDPPVTSPVTLAAIGEDSGPRLITQAELLANASDVDGPPLAATGLAISAGSGSLVDNGDGTWTYTPAPDDDTAVGFSYTITDGIDPIAATASLDITPVNDPPAGTGDSVATLGAQPVMVSAAWLTANDLDADGDVMSITGVSAPLVGSLVDNGDGTWTYSAPAGYSGADSFTYQLADGNGGTDTVTVSVTVYADPFFDDLPGNDDPGPVPDVTPGTQGDDESDDNEGDTDDTGGDPDADAAAPGEELPLPLPGIDAPGDFALIGHLHSGDAATRRGNDSTAPTQPTVKAFFDSMENLQTFFSWNGLPLARQPLYKALLTALDDMNRQMDSSEDPQHQLLVQVASGSSLALSAGFVSWVLRSGALAASLASVMPAWSAFDPIPVLIARRKKRNERKPGDPVQQPPEHVEALFRTRALARPEASEA
jgi:hypothetical protein